MVRSTVDEGAGMDAPQPALKQPSSSAGRAGDEQAVAVVRGRRSDLRAALIAAEAAIAAPIPGRSADWATRVHTALGGLRAAFSEHVVTAEGPDGLFAQLEVRAPRLARACQRLGDEHATIAEALTEAERALAGPPDEVREAVLSVLARLARHRQRGADLMYEAYAVDIGGED
jgi:hypothetical protein